MAGRSRGHVPFAARGRKCQDLGALEEDGGDAEERSLSLWSLSSVDAGAAGLLTQEDIHFYVVLKKEK